MLVRPTRFTSYSIQGIAYLALVLAYVTVADTAAVTCKFEYFVPYKVYMYL